MKEQTKKTRELVPVPLSPLGVFQPQNLSEAVEVAKLIAHSGMVPKQYEGNPGGVLIAIQMGAELGLGPMAALQNIAVINGRPSLWGDAVLALVMSRGDCEDVVESFDDQTKTAKCMVARRGRSPITRTFSEADAKTAGLWGKQGPWTHYPKRMLQMRARGFAVRDAFPDALRGVGVAEEMSDVIDAVPEFAPKADDGELTAGLHGFSKGGRKQPPASNTTKDTEAPTAVDVAPAKDTETEKDWSEVGPPPMTAADQKDLGW